MKSKETPVAVCSCKRLVCAAHHKSGAGSRDIHQASCPVRVKGEGNLTFAAYKLAADRIRCGNGSQADTDVCDAWGSAQRAKPFVSKVRTLLDLPIAERFFYADRRDQRG